MKLKLPFLILILTVGLSSYSQQDLMVSQYTFNHAFLNPAAVGVKGYYNASLMYRNQWHNFEGAPVSQFLSVDGPLISDKMGLGLLVQNEKIGVNRQTDVFANYSYMIDLDKTSLSFGIRGGATMFEANYTDHVAFDEEDAILQENTKTYQPNFGFGIYLIHRNYYAGFSLPHLLNYAPNTSISIDDENANQVVRHYYLMGGYRFHTGRYFVIEPSVLGKHTRAQQFQLDATLLFEYKNRVSLGGGYRSGDSFILLTKLQINIKFQVGYSFDFTTNEIKDYSKGSHEIMLKYMFGNKERIYNPRFH